MGREFSGRGGGPRGRGGDRGRGGGDRGGRGGRGGDRGGRGAPRGGRGGRGGFVKLLLYQFRELLRLWSSLTEWLVSSSQKDNKKL